MKQAKTHLTPLFRSSILFLLWMLQTLLLKPNQGFAQVPIESISIQQGLSQGMIYEILQDREGFLWFATKDGLNRFDGYNLKVFSNEAYNPHSLSGNSILKLFEDHQGRIWVVTDNEGLNVYDKKSGRFQRIQHDPKDPLSLSSNQIRSVVEDAEGNMLATADGADLNVIWLAGDSFEKNSTPKIRRIGLSKDLNLTGIAKDSKGRVWMGGDDHCIYQFDSKTFQLRKAVEGYSFEVAYANSDGTLWASDQNHSPFHWDGKRAAPLFEELSQVLDLQVAPDGKLWLIKGSSLYGLDLQKWKPGKPLKWSTTPFFTQTKAPLNALVNIKELDTAKTRLYTNITHEFRTPLTVIMGMAQQTLEKPSENLAFKQEMILRNGQQLLQLVNEMLDLSRLESGKMALRFIQGDVIAFLRYMLESFHSLAESQQKQLHFLSTLQELNCAYDPEKLRQIVSNLLSNALKFTPESGNIYLSIDRSLQAEKPFLQITVKDTGIGIPEAKLPYIFDRFYQVDDSTTRPGEGAGIGLALTKELVNLLEGEIRVNSPAIGSTKGSEFTVLLPFQIAAAPIAESEPDAREKPLVVQANLPLTTPIQIKKEARHLILLVEDNPDVAAYLNSCLPDYRLEFAVDGQEGLDKATELIPDLIISDVMMPRMDGFTLCQHLRDDERSSHIPIILLTAKADFESKLTGLDRGADVYLEKPFQPEELRLRIKKLLELREKLKQHYSQTFKLQDYTAPEAPALEKREDVFVQKIRECIEANLSDHTFSIEQLCKAIHLSQRQLQRKLEALTGFSPNQFIRSIRLNHAKKLLRDPDLSITAVAYDCGFSDPSYFARVFKQEFDKTPLEWREAARKVFNEV